MRYPTRTIFSSNKFTINAAVYGPVWKSLRRNMVQNMLSSTRLREFRTVRDNAMENLINRLKLKQRTIMALSSSAKMRGSRRSVSSLQCVLASTWKNTSPFFSKQRKIVLQVRKEQVDFIVPLIEQRRKAIENPGSDEIATTFSYLDTLFDLKVEGRKSGPLNDELVSLCSKFLNGGMDTTAMAVEWEIAQLIANPKVQEKLYREIKECIGWWDLRLERKRRVVTG
ncbi:Cytochrome P450 [Arachis hypogaea]|nr:Cytochrome P450 [Arachis hypogaea]